MDIYTLLVAAVLVLAVLASHAHTRRFGTKRNIKLIYPLMFGVFFVESVLNATFRDWQLDQWCLRPLMLLWVALIFGSLLTWRRINRRGNNWSQIVRLRERNALANE